MIFHPQTLLGTVLFLPIDCMNDDDDSDDDTARLPKRCLVHGQQGGFGKSLRLLRAYKERSHLERLMSLVLFEMEA